MRPTTRSSQPDPTALVVLFLESTHPLWDPRASALTGRLAESLPGTFVTSAFLRGRGPSLRDALAAARFMGCRAAVVAWVDDAERTSGAGIEPLVTGPGLDVVVSRCNGDAHAIESLYRRAVVEPGVRTASA